MKRYLKGLFITLASFILLLLISLGILMWFVFTPEKLTPIVQNHAEKHIPYQTEIGEVELTLFSTFPLFGIRIGNFAVISPLSGAPCDTLLKADELLGVINAGAYLRSREVIIDKFILSNGSLNIFADSLGNSNYSLLMTETTTEQEESPGSGFDFVDVENIELKNFSLSYNSITEKLNTSITDLTAKVTGKIRKDNFRGRFDISHAIVSLEQDGDKINTTITGLTAKLEGNIREGSSSGHINLNNAEISFEHNGEKYLDRARLKFAIPFDILPSRQWVQFNGAFASVNDLGVTVSGSFKNDTIGSNVFADISYRLNSWELQDAISLIPPSFLAEFGVIGASGSITSDGIIKGAVNDSLLPFMDINLTLAGGTLEYEGLPFPLKDMAGDIHFFSDSVYGRASYLHISSFEAKTPNSSFKTRGKVDHLFSDMHYNLITDANVLLDDFRSFIPGDVNLSPGGRITGQLKTDFALSQATVMELDRMKISGSVFLSDFSMIHDSVSMSTDYAKIDFSLPNPHASGINTNFAYAKIASDNFSAAKTDNFSTSLKNTHIYLEMSDLRDTTIIPDLFCTFSMDSLRACMDTISIAIDKPYGNFSVAPVPGAPRQSAILFAYTSYSLAAHMGQNSVSIDELTLKTDVLNDNNQDDVFRQWVVKGSAEMNNGSVYMPALSQLVEIPSIKMDFDPETLNIHEGNIIIDQSDFALTGVLSNVSSWLLNDSILTGNFSFSSGTTDLAQLMMLTSGIGMEAETASEDASPSGIENSASGPYMVPRGVDILLKADVGQAVMGADTITNILGDIRVSDGILLLDGLTFTTPAADMQLTAMYRTPRKNHLYLGLDYHMLDVEISRLLEMLPDIDTLMPMLRSFGGSGEFHIAVETYLDSLYNVKKSTLRGVSSIRGEDLVLMDGETFSEIAKTLRFSKKAENRVDSLSAEFTIFREEIDIYPFLMVMDRYKVVVGGRHNFDMSFDYHISVIESPLPVRLGINIGGTIEQLQYRLTRPQYAEFYRPASRRAVESRQLEFREMIREALLQNLRE